MMSNAYRFVYVYVFVFVYVHFSFIAMDLEEPRNIEIPDVDIDESSEEEDIVMRYPKRYFRHGQSPFEFWNNKEFKRRFRFTKELCLAFCH